MGSSTLEFNPILARMFDSVFITHCSFSNVTPDILHMNDEIGVLCAQLCVVIPLRRVMIPHPCGVISQRRVVIPALAPQHHPLRTSHPALCVLTHYGQPEPPPLYLPHRPLSM